jgi:PqqD family protein of HPr-rel-A system
MKIKGNIAVSESGFVFDSNTGESYHLNNVAISILNHLKQNLSESELKTRIKTEYDVEADELDSTIYDFIYKLREYNLLEYER